MFLIARQKLTQSLKERVSEINGPDKDRDLREIEDAFQYGEDDALELFDRVLHCGYSLYFVRAWFLNAAKMIRKDIGPELTEGHLHTFAALHGGSGLGDQQLVSLLKLIMDRSDDGLLIASILRDRKITDPEEITRILAEQNESAKSFSSGVL